MFTVLSFNAVSGTFTEVSNHKALDQAKEELKSRHSEASPHIVTWDNEEGLAGSDEDAMLQSVLDANDGQVLRVMKNVLVDIQHLDQSRVCCGSGSNCFCVSYANGTRQCETKYCNANGFCWWVKCNIPCGC